MARELAARRSLLVTLCAWHLAASVGPQPNPPDWPDSVLVFDSDHTGNIGERLQKITDAASVENRVKSHFSSDRWALLFKRGKYRALAIPTGYYTQVLGLGESVDDVTFSDPVDVDGGLHAGPYIGSLTPPGQEDAGDPGSLDTFWRGAENFKVEGSMTWAVSQAAPLRRIHVTDSLLLTDAGGYASGGFLASSQVDNRVDFGGQQQWMSRNNHFKNSSGGAYSLVFVGCEGGVPNATEGKDNTHSAISVVDHTPVIAEKPFITFKEEGGFFLQVPPIQTNVKGFDKDQSAKDAGMRSVPFEEVFVADASKHGSSEIQKMLDQGFHVVLAAGIFALNHTLTLSYDQQVLLGIGMATLAAPPDGSPCVKVRGNKRGVRVAGIMLAASKTSSSTESVLLQWGDPEDSDSGAQSHLAVAGVLSDVFARVGGPDLDRTVGVDKIMKIYEDQVIGDNIWLWRADHAALPGAESGKPKNDNPPSIKTEDHKEDDYHLPAKGEYPCKTGLEVYGVNVTMYGLFVEHTTENLTNWYGDGGRVYFYQSELPYDVESASTGYFVSPEAGSHEGHGIGVYTYFRDYDVTATTGIVAPDYEDVRFENTLAVKLNGKGGMSHVINDQGAAVTNKPGERTYASFRGAQPICPGTPACPAEGPACLGPACSPDEWSQQGLIVAAVGVVVFVSCLGSAVLRMVQHRAATATPGKTAEAAAAANAQVDLLMKVYARVHGLFARRPRPAAHAAEAEKLCP